MILLYFGAFSGNALRIIAVTPPSVNGDTSHQPQPPLPCRRPARSFTSTWMPFFASVEQLDRPELRGLPVIVGGQPQSRGVVAACSYEARAFGIHSAMPCGKAHQLCPQAVFVRPRMARYSGGFAADHGHLSPLHPSGGAVVGGRGLSRRHRNAPAPSPRPPAWPKPSAPRSGRPPALTASAGVSYNKFLAKIASGHHKPDGLTVIPPEQAQAFIAALPIGKFFGVGRVTEQKM